jgi:hypothetical protein
MTTQNGMWFIVGTTGDNTGSVTTRNGALVQAFSTSAKSVTNSYGVHVANMALYNSPTTTAAFYADPSTTAVGTNKYGLRIGDQSGATNNYAIYTGLGTVRFGDKVGVNVTPSAMLTLPSGTTTANTAPLKFTSGSLLTTTEAGAIEFLTDDYYATITTGAGGSYSYYPPGYSTTYVKATSSLGAGYESFRPANPSNSLTGDWTNNCWLSNSATTNQAYHIDLGSAKLVNRIYYENAHHNGGTTSSGGKDYNIYGSNVDSAFADTAWASDGNWTLLQSGLQFVQHVSSDVSDPKFQTITNTSSYRYYRLKIANNWSGLYIGLRRIELQDTTQLNGREKIVLTNGATGLTSGRIPYATTNGRLTDSNLMTFDTNGIHLDANLFFTAGHGIVYSSQIDKDMNGLNYLASLVPKTNADGTIDHKASFGKCSLKYTETVLDKYIDENIATQHCIAQQPITIIDSNTPIYDENNNIIDYDITSHQESQPDKCNYEYTIKKTPTFKTIQKEGYDPECVLSMLPTLAKQAKDYITQLNKDRDNAVVALQNKQAQIDLLKTQLDGNANAMKNYKASIRTCVNQTTYANYVACVKAIQ